MLSFFLAQTEADALQVPALTFVPRALLRITSDQLRKLFFRTFAVSPVVICGLHKSEVEVQKLIWTGRTRTVSNSLGFFFREKKKTGTIQYLLFKTLLKGFEN